jgi:hypothetical protein
VGAFDGGVIRSEAGALLLGVTDSAIRLVGRFAAPSMIAARRFRTETNPVYTPSPSGAPPSRVKWLWHNNFR